MTIALTALIAALTIVGLLLLRRLGGAVGVLAGALLLMGGMLAAGNLIPRVTGEPFPASAFMLFVIPVLGLAVWHATHPHNQLRSADD